MSMNLVMLAVRLLSECGTSRMQWKAYTQLHSCVFKLWDEYSTGGRSTSSLPHPPPLDNIQVMVIVWRLRRNIIRTALCWTVWHNVHSSQHSYVSSSYRSNRLGLSHWDPYAVRRGGCLELYYCNILTWWSGSDGIQAWSLTTNWFLSVLWHCWFGHQACKNRPRNDLLCVEWDIKPYTLTPPPACWVHARGCVVASD